LGGIDDTSNLLNRVYSYADGQQNSAPILSLPGDAPSNRAKVPQTSAPFGISIGNISSTSTAAPSSSIAGGSAPLPPNAKYLRTPVIIYASRTHSQLAQVLSQLKKAAYRPATLVLGSREQLCAHHTVSKMTSTAQNYSCRELTTAHKCSLKNHLDEEAKENRLGSMLDSGLTPYLYGGGGGGIVSGSAAAYSLSGVIGGPAGLEGTVSSDKDERKGGK
jgi:hypothetical protein